MKKVNREDKRRVSNFSFICICSIVLFFLAVLEYLSSVMIKGKNYMAPIVMIVSIVLMLVALGYILFFKKSKRIYDFLILIPLVVWISSLILIVGYTLFDFSSPYQTYNIRYVSPCFIEVTEYRLLEINTPLYDFPDGSRTVLNLNLIISFMMMVILGSLWLLEHFGKLKHNLNQDNKKKNYFILMIISLSLLLLSILEYFTRLSPAQGRIYLLVSSILIILVLMGIFIYYMFLYKNKSSVFIILLIPIIVWILSVTQMFTTEPFISLFDSVIPRDYRSYVKFPILLITEFYYSNNTKHSQFGVPVFTFITASIMSITFISLYLKSRKVK